MYWAHLPWRETRLSGQILKETEIDTDTERVRDREREMGGRGDRDREREMGINIGLIDGANRQLRDLSNVKPCSSVLQGQ